MSSSPPRRSRSRPPVYVAASHSDDRPYRGDKPPPVRLVNAPLLFVTTLSVALGIPTQRDGAPGDVPDTDPSPPPSSLEPSTDRMPQPPSFS